MSLLKKLSFGNKDNTQPQPGRFVVIDGPDGSGKTTQTNLLVEELKANGLEVEMADFPQYGKKSAVFVEEYLNGTYGAMSAQAASIFYAVDRFDASFRIRELLQAGKIVISNRYVTANAGHQGGKISDENERLKYFRWLNNLEYEIFGIPKPDLNVILHVPTEVAIKLLKERRKNENAPSAHKKADLHEQDIEHLKNATEAYLQIAKLFPNTKLVECFVDGRLLSPNEVHNKVWELVRRIALKGR